MTTQTQTPTISERVAEQRYGKVVHKDDHRVVRVVTSEDGDLTIKVHRIEDGFERLPRGYLLGTNILQHKA